MRTDPDLLARYRSVLGHLGLLLLLAGAAMALPLLFLAAEPSEAVHAPAFAVPAVAVAGLGFLLRRRCRPRPSHSFSVAEGGVVLVLAWAATCVASAVPLMASLGLTFTQAVFESVSAWTTTGLSVVDVSAAPRIVLLWRSEMQLLGGAGMAIVLLTAGGGPLGPGFAAAEGRGDQLVPHVRRSARLVAVIYAGYAVAGTAAYSLAGMSFFDALNHAFAAVSTGGFSTRPESIGAWDSVAIEAVSIPLMLVGSFHFQTVHLFLVGRWAAVRRNAEMRFTALALPAAAAVVLLLLWGAVYPSLGRAVRSAIFETTSALTTTGFSLTAYSAWPSAAVLVLIALMVVGGHTGSTAGGLKQLRAHLLARAVGWELRRLLRPHSAVVVREVGQGAAPVAVGTPQLLDLAAIVALYVACLVVGVFVLLVHGVAPMDAVFEIVSSLSTVGLSIGVTSAGAPSAVLWTQTLCMFLGRLEFLIVVVTVGKLVRDARALAAGRVPG